MADDIDTMLQSEEERTHSASPAGNKTQVDDSTDPNVGSEQQTPEEIEWNSLKGGTRTRIEKILEEKRIAETERDALKTARFVPPPPPMYANQPNPDVQDAVRKLSDVGIATDDKVERKINESLGALRYEYELERLGSKYSGNDGRPAFSRSEYEDYISRHAEYRGYLPEDVYGKMYSEELRDWEFQNLNSKQSSGSKTLRPMRTTSTEEPLSPEVIEQRLKEPDGAKWYDKNIDKINAILGRMS